MNSADKQYYEITKRILEEGTHRTERTGTGATSLFGAQMVFDLEKEFPILSSKQVFWKTAMKEILWMLSGSTSIMPLIRQNVRIWTEWPHKAYCEAHGLDVNKYEKKEFEKGLLDGSIDEKWAELGNTYGGQWRAWKKADGTTVDQVQGLIDTIKNNPFSRRIIMSGWNVGELDEMLLPPCHAFYQWHVETDKEGNPSRLGCVLTQRSADWMAGVPFNLVNQALMTMMLARECGLKPGKMIWNGADVHCYDNHVKQAKEQMRRVESSEVPQCTPSLVFKNDKSFFDITIDDIDVIDYKHLEKISLPIAV